MGESAFVSRGFHGDALRVAVGLFCLLLGALVLVAPHKLVDSGVVAATEIRLEASVFDMPIPLVVHKANTDK